MAHLSTNPRAAVLQSATHRGSNCLSAAWVSTQTCQGWGWGGGTPARIFLPTFHVRSALSPPPKTAKIGLVRFLSKRKLRSTHQQQDSPVCARLAPVARGLAGPRRCRLMLGICKGACQADNARQRVLFSLCLFTNTKQGVTDLD